MKMSQAEYARHRGVSRAYVSRLVKTGKIPPSAWVWSGKKRSIDRDLADRALSENLDPAFTRKIKAVELSEIKLDDIIKGLDNGDILIDAKIACQELEELLKSPASTPESSAGLSIQEVEELLEFFRFSLKTEPLFVKKMTPWIIV